MACKNCHQIRSLILHGKMAQAAGLTVDTLREKIGFKTVEEDNTVEDLRYSMSIDAASDHRKASDGGEQGAEAFIPLNPEKPAKVQK